jgi:hypothetical protein
MPRLFKWRLHVSKPKTFYVKCPVFGDENFEELIPFQYKKKRKV